MEDVPGIDVERVTAWLLERVPGVRAPFAFAVLSGGHSNLTVEVTDANGRRLVLRRPPLGSVLSTAHDMGREHRIISALGPTAVPVPATLGHCDHEAVTGAPFYVMEHVDGAILHDLDDAERRLAPGARGRAAASVVDVLADLHALEPDDVGLGDLGRREDYVARQLRRWSRQYEQSRTRRVPEIEQVHDALSATIPEQGPAAIVHGDYKLGNLVHAADGTVAAVLDWELCTLGDPLADLGYLVLTWADDEQQDPRGGAASLARGFPPSEELVARYAARSGRDTGDIDYYVAFSAWRLACILEGVYARYMAGALGEPPAEAQTFADLVVAYARRAKEQLPSG